MFFRYLQFIVRNVFIHNRLIDFNKPARKLDRFVCRLAFNDVLNRATAKAILRAVWVPIRTRVFLPFTMNTYCKYTLKAPYISYSQFKYNVQWREDAKAHIRQRQQEAHRNSYNITHSSFR